MKTNSLEIGVIVALIFITALTGVASCSSCSATIEYNSIENIIYVYGNGSANLSCIDNEINDSTVLNETSPKVWLLNASIYVNGSDTTLYINSSDCIELRMNETNVFDNRIVNISIDGELYIDSTTIQSWNALSNSPVIFNKYSTGERPYIFVSGYAEIRNSTIKHFKEIFANRSDNLKIEGNRFYEMMNCLRAASSDIMTIRNNEINYTAILLGDGWPEISGDDGCDYNIIENNTFIGWTERGGHLLRLEDKNDHNIIRNNTFTINPEFLIWLYVGSNYNIIENNTLIGGASEDDSLIYISSSASHNVIRNNILNFTGGIGAAIDIYQFSFDMTNNTIINNTILNSCTNNATGIKVQAENPLKHYGVVVENNIIKNFGYGIKIGVDAVDWVYDSLIANNIIYKSKLQGIIISRADNLTIKNNVIYNSSDDAIKIINSNASNITIKNNILVSNGGYGINTVQSDIENNYNDVWNNTLGNYNGTSAGTDDISEDPLFADPASGDFHPKSQAGRWNGTDWVYDNETSPCIDAGDPNSSYSNETYPHGQRINMGAYGNTPEASKSPYHKIYLSVPMTIYSNGEYSYPEPPITYKDNLTVNITFNVSDTTNLTINSYTSSQISFTATNTTTEQKMNITVFNGTFIVVNGKKYEIKKDGVVQQTKTASDNKVVFTDIPVGSDYVITEESGGKEHKLPVARPVCATGIAILIVIAYWRYRRRRRRMRSGRLIVLVPGLAIEWSSFIYM